MSENNKVLVKEVLVNPDNDPSTAKYDQPMKLGKPASKLGKEYNNPFYSTLKSSYPVDNMYGGARPKCERNPPVHQSDGEYQLGKGRGRSQAASDTKGNKRTGPNPEGDAACGL